MTQTAIQRQIEIIRQASAEARKSKESARQFLIEAGIIKDEQKKKPEEKEISGLPPAFPNYRFSQL